MTRFDGVDAPLLTGIQVPYGGRREFGHIQEEPKIRDEKLWDSKKPRFLMKMSPIYF